MKIYKAAPGASYGNKDAQALGIVLESLPDQKPQTLVDAARPVKSPVHHMFEWNNTAAAERWRLSQARNHINHLKIIIVTPEGERRTKAYHSVMVTNEQDEQERQYCALERISKDDSLRDQVLQSALAAATAWQERYAEYERVIAELKPIFAGIKKAKARAKARRRRAVA